MNIRSLNTAEPDPVVQVRDLVVHYGARRILARAVETGRPIAVVEVMSRSALAVAGILLAPLFVTLSVPFLRPFRWAWIPFTYLVPVIPIFVLWDGIVSVLRIYDEGELRALAAAADPHGRFDWQVETIPMPPAPVPGVALVGIPRIPRQDA